MPRKAAGALVQDALTDPDDLLPPDPAPATPRRRGRPPGSTNKAPAKKATGNRGRIAVRTPTGAIMSKAAMQAKVHGEIIMYLQLAAGGWSLRDPICAAAATDERIEKMAASLVSMISRDDKLLAYAAKSGILGDIAMFCNAVWPIAKEVYRHHGPGSTGHDQPPVELRSPDELARDYPAYNGTRR